MASLAVVFPRHLMAHSLATLLELQDISRLQATDCATKSVLEDAACWSEKVSDVLPHFDLAKSLFEEGTRGRFMMLCKTLSSASFSHSLNRVPAPLRKIDEAVKLAKALAKAKEAAALHEEKLGSPVRVFLARLQFDEENMEAAFKTGPLDSTNQGDRMICLGKVVEAPPELAFECAMRSMTPDRFAVGEHRCIPEEVRRLHFAWMGGRLVVSARDDDMLTKDIIEQDDRRPWAYWGDEDEYERCDRHVTLDLVACDSAWIMQYSGVAVPKNASWHGLSSGGICSCHRVSKRVAMEALTRGVLCVISLRGGMPETTTNLAKTLHLDTPKW
mmetsp:Transcript_132523/g.383050  ORF Transcript_132523/g.383050 Transcript_132523/m.383050 type:complete len:330 (-) Transcript_132523:83-1072(-)